MREEMRRKNEGGKRKGREEEHALRGRASSILRNSDIALYSASPPSYGPLDRHALPRNHGKTGGRKKWRWRWNRKSRSCLSKEDVFIIRSRELLVGSGIRKAGTVTFLRLLMRRNVCRKTQFERILKVVRRDNKFIQSFSR